MNKNLEISNIRSKKQETYYQKILKENIDPFEKKHFLKYHPHPILYENKSWFVSKNAFPYKNSSLHFLLVYKKNINSLEKITKDGWLDLHNAYKYLIKKYEIPSGAIMMRFGTPKDTGASVFHLHAHLIVAKKTKIPKKIFIKIE